MTLADRPVAVARDAGGGHEPNPYLMGVFAPVKDEITADDLEIVGEIPRDLNGVYLRNGPNRRFDAPGRYHMFDGDGMIHAVHFEDGRVRYRNRYVRTQAFHEESAAGRALWTGVMENPGDNPFGNGHGLGLKDSANTDVIFHRGRVLATWYLCGSPYAVDPLSLETIGAEDFLGTLNGDMMAHPKVDEATGELFWFDYGPQPPYMRYGVVGSRGTVDHVTDIELPGPRLPHDMAITANHSILMDLPLIQDQAARAAGKYRICFERSLPSRFGVIPRHGDGTTIRWFEAKPCYIYHVVNAWEEGDEIVLDVCRVKNPQHKATFRSPLAQMLAYLRLDAHIYRYRFDLVTGRTTEGRLDDDNIEFPSVDTRVTSRPHRYSYVMHLATEETLLFDGLVRFDSVTGAKHEHFFGPGRWGAEAPFAPRDGSTGETDGYVVSFINDEREGRAEVAVFDAEDIAAGPVGRVLLPQRVPSGFHATWVRADQLRPSGLPR
ncbi:carotenoid oxygenase family protein [Planotetraspora kaengkrachanensis]|uniref:Dioxygenase n=1 Tax=Planotetraspora kaengkrachanensis TaxID=575193 RepID=A0A8J3PSZ6_9ACTN|nr:carotenoid oxygenase family protein [Planotetraspora kaengkrachanensis]GIG78941.1 carotenoid cleavage dioxygenase [Planotetraspora kaengkrachanensis]